MSTKKTKKPVVVFDIHRGIYFGYLVKHDLDRKTVRLKGGRHCFYFPIAEAGHKGVYGLATVGPGEGSKVGPSVTMTVHDVSKVVDCEPRAVKMWEKARW